MRVTHQFSAVIAGALVSLSSAAEYVMPALRAGNLTVVYIDQGRPANLSAAEAEAMVKEAVESWSSCAKLEYGGVSTSADTDKVIPIRWSNKAMHALTRISHNDRQVVKAAIELPANPELLRNLGDKGYVRYAMIHEMGHALGLPHGPACTASVMSGVSLCAAPRQIVPSRADIAFCRSLNG